MMFTTPMKLLAAAVLREDSRAVADALLRLGVMDAISIKDLPQSWSGKVEPAKPEAQANRTAELRKRAEGFFALSDPPLSPPDLLSAARGPTEAESKPLDLSELSRGLDGIAEALDKARERQKASQDDLLKLRDMRKQVESMSGIEAAVPSVGGKSFLRLFSGTIPGHRVGALESSLSGIPSVVLKGEAGADGTIGLMVMALKRDEQRVGDALRREGWTESAMPDAGGRDKQAILAEISAKEKALLAERAARGDEIRAILLERADSLYSIWSSLRLEELSLRVRSGFSRSERAVFLTGWIPEAERGSVERALREASSGRCYVEWLSPEGDEVKGLSVPVTMSNPAALRPFQDLVANYAMPEYGTIDPTPFVAVAYLCMFGLMFGDAGHGLVLALVGLFGMGAARKKGAKEGLYRLILYCGGAAIVSGLLFGSIFGQKLLPPLWFDYHGAVMGGEGGGPVSSIYGILGITVKFGMAVLALGMVLNWLNLIRKRRWFALVFDKAGFLGAWIYAAGAWVAFFFVGHDYKEMPALGLIALLLGLPTLALGLKAPIEFARERKRGGRRLGAGALFNFVLEWAVEVLEIYSGYLANTLSFMRVAGLGIAHVSLMVAFAQMAAMASPGGGLSIAGLLIMIAGNAMVIALEGLSAGIQSLRLNYYEFFSKYFNGTGRAYKPISLRSRD